MDYKRVGRSSKYKVPRWSKKFGLDIRAEIDLQDMIAMDVRAFQPEIAEQKRIQDLERGPIKGVKLNLNIQGSTVTWVANSM